MCIFSREFVSSRMYTPQYSIFPNCFGIYQSNTSLQHWIGRKKFRIFIKNQELWAYVLRSDKPEILGYTDSDYMKSTLGNNFMLARGDTS